MKVTCKEISELFGVDYLQASGLLKILIKSGVCEISGENRSSGRGRPTVEYKLPRSVTIDFSSGKIDGIGEC
ncbi:MAG: hypothetical protein FI729_03360 [SAR202 cluster bacterium]|nr:hypothetical protein [SAR202 cluster bacterium]|tara:strand:- start:10 stop:225 length:216 start_codon:yes stop_codon:yes gene_type:complete